MEKVTKGHARIIRKVLKDGTVKQFMYCIDQTGHFDPFITVLHQQRGKGAWLYRTLETLYFEMNEAGRAEANKLYKELIEAGFKPVKD